MLSNLLGIYLRVEFLGYMKRFLLFFGINYQTVTQSGPLAMLRALFAQNPLHHLVASIFIILAILIGIY